MKIHEASKILILGQIVGFTVKRGAVVTSRCHGSKISGSQQTVLLQIWQKTQKSLKKMTFMTFSCSIALRNKTVANTFRPSSNNANGRLSQEVMLRSRNFATMVT